MSYIQYIDYIYFACIIIYDFKWQIMGCAQVSPALLAECLVINVYPRAMHVWIQRQFMAAFKHIGHNVNTIITHSHRWRR